MSLWGRIRRRLNGMNLPSEAKTEFGVKEITNSDMRRVIDEAERIYQGTPDWASEADHIKTINFARAVCSETARLATMNIKVEVSGSARAEWLQQQIDGVLDELRHWTEYGCALGTIALKPNGDTIDIVTPDKMAITNSENGLITGVVFLFQTYVPEEDRWYSRLEYHHRDGDKYKVENRCFYGSERNAITKEIDIKKTPWNDLVEEMTADNVDGMLFGVFRTPAANNIDIESPLGIPMFWDAMTELRDLDVAYSLNAWEIEQSKRTVVMDSDRLLQSGTRVGVNNKDVLRQAIGLPDYVKFVEGTGSGDIYHEINPTLNTAVRQAGIDALLSQVGYKCGFSNGYFVFNSKTGMVTATQVESDDRRTLQMVNDVRHELQKCIDQLLYALDKFADAYKYAPSGKYEVAYDFADLTLNNAEDKARWYGYVQNGHVPFWYYLTKYEGYSEEDAKALDAEVKAEQMANIAAMGGFEA